MRKETEKNVRDRSSCKTHFKRSYVRPKLSKREKLAMVTGGVPVITS